MTPVQQTALTGLMGRELTQAEIDALSPLLDPNNRNDVAITALINAGQADVVGSLSVDDVFDSLYQTGDYATLKAAQLSGNQAAVIAFESLYDAKNIGKNKVNLSLSTTISLLDGLEAAGLLSTAGRAALTTAATTKAATVRVEQVSRALNIAEGRMVI